MDEWAVVEITERAGVTIHDKEGYRYVVGGDENGSGISWAKAGAGPVRWVLDPHGGTPGDRTKKQWPGVKSGDLSRNGLLAVARSHNWINRYPWLTEIYRFADGKRIAQIDNHPLAVGWSHDGRTLAILQVGGEGREDDPIYLCLWQLGRGVIAKWDVDYCPFVRLHSSTMDNRFALSWNADDSYIAVSTLAVPRNAMDPKCTIVRVADGPVCSIGASNAYFVGADLIAANDDGQWTGAWLMRLTGDHVEKVERIGGQLFIAGSDPAAGVYVAWHPPPLWPPKAQPRLAFRDLSGRWSVEQTGFRVGSTFRLVQVDRLENLLGDRDCSADEANEGSRGRESQSSFAQRPLGRSGCSSTVGRP